MPGVTWGVILNYVDLKYSLSLQTLTETSQARFRSTNFLFGPTCSVIFPVSNKISIDSRIGYELNYSGDLKSKDGDILKLLRGTQDNVKAQWDGLRIGLGVRYKFGKNS